MAKQDGGLAQRVLFKTTVAVALGMFSLSYLTPCANAAQRYELNNDQPSAEFDASGLVRLSRSESKQPLTFRDDSAARVTERQKKWSVSYSEEELFATWRGSDRLPLYVHIADSEDKWTLALKVNGQPIEVKKAYSDVFPLGRDCTFTGFYADLSSLKPDTRHEVAVTVPDTLQPGQFQGLFFENVEAEFTDELAKQVTRHPASLTPVKLSCRQRWQP